MSSKTFDIAYLSDDFDETSEEVMDHLLTALMP